MVECISFKGKSLRVGYNMAVAIGYEKETGEVFDMLTSFQSATNITTLFWVVLKKYNPDFKLSKDEFAEESSGAEYHALDLAMAELLKEFYWVPANEGSGNGQEEKNA